MISAFRTGETAGSAAYRDPLVLPTSQPRQIAIAVLAERKRLGIAHCYPEEEFIQGFLAGYKNPQPFTDGLVLAQQSARTSQSVPKSE
jgi:hypothetical protein